MTQCEERDVFPSSGYEPLDLTSWCPNFLSKPVRRTRIVVPILTEHQNHPSNFSKLHTSSSHLRDMECDSAIDISEVSIDDSADHPGLRALN